MGTFGSGAAAGQREECRHHRQGEAGGAGGGHGIRDGTRCGIHGGRAQRHRRWFRAPARADRRSAFPGLRAAALGGGSAQLHFHSKRWCGTHVGRGQRHQCWFRAPARCRSETGAPWPAAPLRLVGARCNCIFTARGGVPLTVAGRSVMRAGFALPRDAGRRPALRRAPAGMGCGGEFTLAGGSVIGAGFALPARCRSEVGVPWPARRSAWWGLGATAFSQQEVVCHLRWQGAAS